MSEVDSRGHPLGSVTDKKDQKAGGDESEPRYNPDLHHGGDDDTISQDHYTHQRDSGIEEDDEPIEMIDGSVQDGAEHKKDQLKEVEPDPIENETIPDAQSNVPDQKEGEQKQGLGSKALSGAKGLAGRIGGGLGAKGATDKADEQLPDAAKDAKAGVDEKTGDAAGAVDEKTAGATDQIPSTDDAKDKLDETKEGLPSTEDAKDQIPSTEEAGETVGDAKDKVGETAEGAKDQAGETVEGAKDTAGETVEGAKDTAGKEADGALDKAGEAGEGVEAEPPLDFSILKGGKVNKGGNVVDEDGKLVGRIKEGVLVHLVGKRVDEEGNIWSDSGKKIGKAEPIAESEREELGKASGPFESFPDAVVDANGMIVFNGETIGKVVEGDAKVLRGKTVDPDGEILDRAGNVVGRAERWEPEPEKEAEPEPEADRSVLAGKRVNKAGNVLDGSGVIFGKVVDGDPKRMVGRMCDKKGNILSESGDILGRAEVVPEGEREGQKEGLFAELSGCTVNKEGKVVSPGGDVVGRLVNGDPKVLYGRAVDEDGDVCDKNGNVLGHAERWEEPVVEKKKNALSGRKVNREGNVVDEDGNLVGKLTSGELSVCSGKEIDDDGDVVDGKGRSIGHVSLLEDIPAEPEESAEDKQKREQLESDKKLAKQMSGCLEQCLEKIRPICKMITDKIERAERTPKEELDEEELVKQVRPLIEEGGKILQEANGIIRGLDPDGRIQANAKHKSATRDASPEEHHLADVLKELTGTVATTIDNAKKKIEDMPHAKKQLNPLWGLLNEPLFQILAAVGLLLNGVLSLVGRLLNGLGLGGIVDGLLGTLGLNRVLEGLGLGSVTGALGGGKDKEKTKGGGLLGGLVG